VKLLTALCRHSQLQVPAEKMGKITASKRSLSSQSKGSADCSCKLLVRMSQSLPESLSLQSVHLFLLRILPSSNKQQHLSSSSSSSSLQRSKDSKHEEQDMFQRMKTKPKR